MITPTNTISGEAKKNETRSMIRSRKINTLSCTGNNDIGLPDTHATVAMMIASQNIAKCRLFFNAIMADLSMQIKQGRAGREALNGSMQDQQRNMSTLNIILHM